MREMGCVSYSSPLAPCPHQPLLVHELAAAPTMPPMQAQAQQRPIKIQVTRYKMRMNFPFYSCMSKADEPVKKNSVSSSDSTWQKRNNMNSA